jgi:hypothetical protein
MATRTDKAALARKEYMRKYMTEYGKIWREKNKEHRLEYERMYYQKNKDKVITRTKMYYEKNKEELLVKYKASRSKTWHCPHCGDEKKLGSRYYHLYKSKCAKNRGATEEQQEQQPIEEQEVIEDDFLQPTEEEPLPPPPTEEELLEILMLEELPHPPTQFCSSEVVDHLFKNKLASEYKAHIIFNRPRIEFCE